MTDPSRKEKLLQYLTGQIKEVEKVLSGVITLSQNYHTQAQTAQTKPKQNYFSKKLKKNNQIVIQLVQQLDTYQKMLEAAEKQEDVLDDTTT